MSSRPTDAGKKHTGCDSFDYPPDRLWWVPFEAHYGKEASRERIAENVYGGRAIASLFKNICFEASDDDLENACATITLEPQDVDPEVNVEPLILVDAPLKQFLIAGLPRMVNGPVPKKWGSKDRWEDLDPQYRLELCHSEISRWSVFFKRDNRVRGETQIQNGDDFTDIELVNNCATSTGFEFRVKRKGVTYHGSFGGSATLADVYQKLSIRQAGTWARQTEPLGAGKPVFGFLCKSIYYNSLDWGPATLAYPDNTLPIDLERYRGKAEVEAQYGADLEIEEGTIDYLRWGRFADYFQKPHVRGLFAGLVDGNGFVRKTPPSTYAEIRDAREVRVPNFEPSGVYNFGAVKNKRGYAWLHELDRKGGVVIRKLDNGLFELELRRSHGGAGYEPRRLVFGNLALSTKTTYPKNITLHRFGFGARCTSMDCDPKFALPGETEGAHYGYFLAGVEPEPACAHHYICPESFGVERAIFSWVDDGKTTLVIDLISFERILPVWQGRVSFPVEVSEALFT